MRGRLIAVEGPDASGKSSQAGRLAAALGALATREPGGTAIGEQVRAVLLDPENAEMSHRTEALLYAAARAQHVDEVVEPALAAGRHVVTDRFVLSSIVYQGVGRGLGIEPVTSVNRWATGGLEPDLVLLLDVPWDVASARLGSDLDRLERAGAELQQAVREAFLTFAAHDAQRYAVIDGGGTTDEVASAMRSAVRERLGL